MANYAKQKGNYGENVALGYLRGKGYEIIKQNYKRGSGEIDIIARDKDYLVFVEVKYRRAYNAAPREAVNSTKVARFCNAVKHYLHENNLWNTDMRFDVLEITGTDILDVEHIENAFFMTGV